MIRLVVREHLRQQFDLADDRVAGDVLVLTKPLGTGVLSTALKRDFIGESGFTRKLAVYCV